MLMLYSAIILGSQIMSVVIIAAGVNVGQFNSHIIDIAIEFAYMLVFLYLMLIFRPRKEWPEHYGLGFETIHNLILVENGRAGHGN